ncbi:COMM domain-containing protein 10 isoform X1 [Passer montanus]|uniref:COMM domain-containing protein 10 isoform X1 n=1 Tax=Passer montanus TaxID=9160 RepID=UPI00196212AE|nr:COMM domain-containing protein 10 isoform X1 [Passer montanus]
MSFSSKLIPRFPGFALPSLGAVRQRLALPGHRRGRARAAAMAAPVVPESDSIRRAVSLLNTVDPGRFPRLLSRLLQKLHLKAESTFSEEEEEKLQIAFSLEKQDLHLVLETISFILEQAVYHNLKPASLQQQLQSIHLDQDKAEAFASAWAAAGQDTIEKFRQRVLTPQKLETVGWQLNLQMAESMQAKLKSPQAVLELGVSNEDSKNLKKVFVEFSHKELFEFYNKLETIQAQLDSLT